jgi:hypothetical protein
MVEALEGLDPQIPKAEGKGLKELQEVRAALVAEQSHREARAPRRRKPARPPSKP